MVIKKTITSSCNDRTFDIKKYQRDQNLDHHRVEMLHTLLQLLDGYLCYPDATSRLIFKEVVAWYRLVTSIHILHKLTSVNH